MNDGRRGHSASAWIDLICPSDTFFFRSIVDSVPEIEPTTTVRKKTETVDLANEVGFEYEIIGRDFDNTLLRKLGIPLRTAQLSAQAPSAAVSFSFRNAMCILASRLRGIPSIHFTDNDITAHVDGLRIEEYYNRFEASANYNIVPEAFEVETLTRWGADPNRVITYPGYKEDIYVANFEPSGTVKEALPFDDYVVIRPEALDAAYVDAERSIVPQLCTELAAEGINIVYLPRGRNDEQFVEPCNRSQVYVPENAFNGLELAWYSDGVLTGSGTMAREAACMGKPAISFFPNSLLSVDREMIKNNMIYHSRDVAKIVAYITSQSNSDQSVELKRSKEVLKEFTDVVRSVLAEVNQPSTVGKFDQIEQYG